MKYEKPEIVTIDDALKAVQNVAKMGDHFDTRPSNAAYTADE
jgi:hypothetical protein